MADEALTPEYDAPVSPGRTIAHADAVIAIAMTLLSLDLKPDLDASATSAELATYLRHHLGQYEAFAIAFGIIAQYWSTHHAAMRGVRRVNSPFIAFNLLFLFWITLVPVTTYIQGFYTGGPLPTFLFALNIALISLSLTLITEVVRRDGLGVPETPDVRLRRRLHSAISLAIPLLIAGLSWTLHGHASWLFLLYILTNQTSSMLLRLLRRNLGRPSQ